MKSRRRLPERSITHSTIAPTVVPLVTLAHIRGGTDASDPGPAPQGYSPESHGEYHPH